MVCNNLWISIHALREEGDPIRAMPLLVVIISIHALREEGDTGVTAETAEAILFLSTPSARRATPDGDSCKRNIEISIHALREEGDQSPRAEHTKSLLISIHALREEGDRDSTCMKSRPSNFYPRPPRGGRRQQPYKISCPQGDFYPRPPRGGRQHRAALALDADQFLSTPSARRATKVDGHGLLPERFLSTPSARRATALCPAAS